MALHEWESIGADTARLSVPGGWLYAYGPEEELAAVFVPEPVAAHPLLALQELVQVAEAVDEWLTSKFPKVLGKPDRSNITGPLRDLRAVLDKLKATGGHDQHERGRLMANRRPTPLSKQAYDLQTKISAARIETEERIRPPGRTSEQLTQEVSAYRRSAEGQLLDVLWELAGVVSALAHVVEDAAAAETTDDD